MPTTPRRKVNPGRYRWWPETLTVEVGPGETRRGSYGDVTRFEVYVDGEHVGAIEKRKVETTRQHASYRNVSDVTGHPARWFAYPPGADGYATERLSRAEAITALIDEQGCRARKQ